MNYGYVRIRKEVADTEMVVQKYSDLLLSLGAEKIIVETDGSELENLLKILKPYDSIYVYAIDRLTRSASKLEELFNYFKKNNITLYEGNRRIPLNINEYALLLAMNQIPQHFDENE